MQITLSINTAQITAADRQILSSIASAAVAPQPATAIAPDGVFVQGIGLVPHRPGLANQFTVTDKGVQIVSGSQPQPQVGDNSGTSATVSPSAEGAGVSGGAAASGAASSASEKKKPGRPKKEEVAAATTGEPAPSTAPVSVRPSSETSTASSPSAAADKPATTLTLDDVRTKLQAFTQVKGIEAGIELLKTFEAGRISELPAAKYSEFVAQCTVEEVAA